MTIAHASISQSKSESTVQSIVQSIVQFRVRVQVLHLPIAEGSAEVRSSDPSARSVGKKIAFIFTFQDGLSWHIHALHCYPVHDIVLNFDDDGN